MMKLCTYILAQQIVHVPGIVLSGNGNFSKPTFTGAIVWPSAHGDYNGTVATI